MLADFVENMALMRIEDTNFASKVMLIINHIEPLIPNSYKMMRTHSNM